VVQLVYDPDDSRDCMRRLAGLHSLAGGCVVCRPAPGPGTRGITTALLRALGKQLRLRDTPHDPRRQLEHAAIWLAAENITDLIVVRADRLTPAAWTMLLDLTRRVPYLTLSLVIHWLEVPERLRAVLGDVPRDEVHYQRLDLAAAAPTPVPPDRGSAFPDVPDTDFPLFVSACQQMLNREDAARVLTAHAAEHADTRAWLHHHRRPPRAMMSRRLGELVGGCGDLNEMLARLRGAQSALFLAGWLAAFEPADVAAAHTSANGSPLDPAAIELLRGYTCTQRAALGAIALATRAPAETLARLAISDVDPRTASIQLAGQHQTVPAAAGGLVRACHLKRRRDGAASDRPLFTTRHAPDRPLNAVGVRRRLRELARDTGLTFAPRDSDAEDLFTVHDLEAEQWRFSTAA
jgi:hypothetical protein